MIKAILATGLNGEVGQNADMPWGKSLPKDLEYFKKVTSDGSVILMGNTTHQSLPFFPKGLPQRKNYVVTNNGRGEQESGVIKLTLSHFERCCNTGDSVFNYFGTWVVGGASIYEQLWHMVDEVHLTTVHNTYPEADTFFKPDLSQFEKVGSPIDVGNSELEATVQLWRRVQ